MIMFISPSVEGLSGIFETVNPILPVPPSLPVQSMDSGYGVSPAQYASNLSGGLQDFASAFQLMDMFLFKGQ